MDVVILQGEHSCTKLQNPLFQNAKENYVPGEKVPVRADKEWAKVLFPGSHPPSETAPLPRERVILSMMDSATPPCGCAQNDSIGGGIRI